MLVAIAALFGRTLGGLFAEQPLPADLVLFGVAFGVVGSLRTVTGAAFYGLRDMVPPSVSDIAWLAAATATLFLLRDQLTPRLTLLVEIVAQLIAVAGLHVVLWRRGFAGAEGAGAVPWGEVGRYAGGAMVMSLLGVVMENVDKPLVGSAPGGGYASVANFHFAAKIVYYGRRLLYLPLAAVGPEFTRVWERGDPDIAVRDLTLVTKLQMMVALALWALATAFAHAVVATLASSAYDDAARVLMVLALVLPLSALYTPATTALRAVDVMWPTVVGDVLWTFVFAGAGWLLLQRGGLGGLAEAQVLASIDGAVHAADRAAHVAAARAVADPDPRAARRRRDRRRLARSATRGAVAPGGVGDGGGRRRVAALRRVDPRLPRADGGREGAAARTHARWRGAQGPRPGDVSEGGAAVCAAPPSSGTSAAACRSAPRTCRVP